MDMDSPALASLDISGTLLFDNKNITLMTEILTLNGVLQIGSAEKKYMHHGQIILKGPNAKFLLQGGRVAMFGLSFDKSVTDPKRRQNQWGFPSFKNIDLLQVL